MKKVVLLFFLIPLFSVAQSHKSFNINRYKYIVVQNSNDVSSLETTVKILNKSGYNAINVKILIRNKKSYPSDLSKDPNLALYLVIDESCGVRSCYAEIKLYNYLDDVLFSANGTDGETSRRAIRNALKKITSHEYKYEPFKSEKNNHDKKIDAFFPSSFNEVTVRRFLDDKKEIDICEGLYRFTTKKSKNYSQYKFLILKKDFNYYGFIVEANCVGCQNWKIGSVKFKMTEMAVDGFFDVSWKYPKKDKKRDEKFVIASKLQGNILENEVMQLIKIYPKSDSKFKRRILKKGEWAGNGSGVIISKSGHIITNHHVIKDVEKIEVEFMLDDELQKFNAEVVQVDKTNDLAVLKIFDMNFDGVNEPPYNFKLRGVDVGTKVYAYGYPMALTIMGKEIKVTDGMISSKTGFDGNITTYQITAPIQGGNSGGPLFDEQANLIGINSSGIRKDIADNVAYSIKTSYVSNLLDILPKSIELPSSTKLQSLPLTEQIKEISKYVVLIKVK